MTNSTYGFGQMVKKKLAPLLAILFLRSLVKRNENGRTAKRKMNLM